ncbi:hypothetical protein BAE44_0014683 [Dichanthelium oligosanthes]|uniref:Uncharacterized protein n=1 Tax=Dichanthelium oligosanthes TaxID=888268 RepID=A0A1E5VGR0_9POAL|nr:hypothetical protein BAE44_0014683 [Dichanthelium oligosanthes]
MAEIALSLVMRLVQEISARLLLDASVLAEKEATLLRSVPGNIRSRIVEVSERNRRYDLVAPYESTSSYMTIMVVLDHMRSRFLDTTQNDNSGDPKKEVDSWASASPKETSKGAPKVAAIAGMCGSGKTNLAQWKSLEFLKDSVLKSENGEMIPEDKEDFQDLDLDSLKVATVLRRWVAEGLVREMTGMSTEAVAVSQLCIKQ